MDRRDDTMLAVRHRERLGDQMPAGGCSVFTDVIGYEVGLRNVVELLAERSHDFSARLTLDGSAAPAPVACQEDLGAHRLRRAAAGVCPGQLRDRPWLDTDLRWFGDMVLQGTGDRLQQRTEGPTRWGPSS